MTPWACRGRLLSAVVGTCILAACGGGSDDDIQRPAGASRERIQSVPPGLSIPADASIKGVFGPLKPWPLIAVHGVMTADGRVMSYGTRENGQQTGYFVYDIWDPSDDSHLTLANTTATDIFCSSQVLLPEGNAIFIAGGDNWTGVGTTNTGNRNSNLLNTSTGVLTRSSDMNRARWYSTSTTLLNGETYIQGGSGGTDFPEVRSIAGSFRLLDGAATGSLDMMYPRNFIAPDGRVFGFDSAGRMYYVDPAGTGTLSRVGQFSSATAGSDSSAAMFAPGRILQYGGNSNGAIVIDITGGTPVVTPTASMSSQRRLSTAALLADGTVVATGGSRVWNQMTDVSYHAEIWNPRTGQWTVGASAVKARLYHGNALLLPDATVLVFGGGAPGPQVNTNAEIYYPPYLFGAGGTVATRPVIGSAPTVVDPGRTVGITVSGSRPVSRVTFVKTGSATHGWNMDQRFVDLPFSAQGNALSVQIPSRASDVPPGTWMMFVIDDAGVPSTARMVRVNVAPTLDTAVAPTLTAPAPQRHAVGGRVDLALAASDPNGDPLRFSASGLPPGLVIDPTTGRITGAPTQPGTYSAVIAASDGYNAVSATVAWTVDAPVALVLAPLQAPAPAAVGSSVSFTASATGQGVRFRWDFGDGSAPTAWSTTATASHVYTRAGLFFATVTATDDRGAESRQTVMHSVHLPLAAEGASASSNLLLEERTGASTRLWVVNPDNDSVSVFDTAARTRVAEVAVGPAPRSLARAPDGSVWVVSRDDASISIVSPSTLAVTRRVALPRASQPYGIAMVRGANAALVVLEATGQLLKIDTAGFQALASLAVGPAVRHVSVAADGRRAFVSRFITPPLPGEGTASVTTQRNGLPAGGELVVVDAAAMTVTRTVTLAHSDVPDAENQGRGVPNYLGALALSPDGSQGFVPGKQDNVKRGTLRDNLPLNFQNTVRAISSRVLMDGPVEDLAGRIDHDNASLASAAVFDPLGVFLFVALETSREVAVLDAHGRNQLMRFDVGRAPQGLAISRDRRTLYVHNFMDRSVGVFDLSALVGRGVADAPAVATWAAVTTEKLPSAVLRGKQFFYDARDLRLSRDSYMSCASCHNDGGHDGRTWDFTGQGEGLRNTISLRGRAGGQGRLHWSNNFDEVQDFEGQIRAFAGGLGLMSDAQFATGTRSQPLGDRKAGVSADLDALAAYVSSLTRVDPSPQRSSTGALTASAAEGRQLFVRMNCASCHAGTAFTRSGTDNPAQIGTLKPASGKRLWGTLAGIDVPTLRDVGSTAPYLHDGSAATLQAAIQAHAGFTGSSADLDRLAAYLQQIGSEEASAPAPATAGAGLLGTYYNGMSLSGAPLLTRTEAVDFNWSTGPGGIGVPTDLFSVRWTGVLTAPSSGTYYLRTVSDDGVRLWVNGSSRINNWTNHAATANTTGGIYLQAGQRVAIRLEYFENRGSAVMQLQWRRPGSSSYVAIPAAQLSVN